MISSVVCVEGCLSIDVVFVYTEGKILMDSENRLILPGDDEYILDASICGNEMALVNHYESVGLNDGRCFPINTQWTSIYYNGWPHILLWTVPGVPIKEGVSYRKVIIRSCTK